MCVRINSAHIISNKFGSEHEFLLLKVCCTTNLDESKSFVIQKTYCFYYIYSCTLKEFFCLKKQTAFTNKKDYGKEEREAQWATAQRTLHGLNQVAEATNTYGEKNNSYRELSEIAEQAKKRAEIARYNSTQLNKAKLPFLPICHLC